MAAVSFFNDLLKGLIHRGRALIQVESATFDEAERSLLDELEALVSSRGEASGTALAKTILGRWQRSDEAAKLEFLRLLRTHFGPDKSRLDVAVESYQRDRTPAAMEALGIAAEPRRQALLRRLNLAPEGTANLVKMREFLLKAMRVEPDLAIIDADFLHLFTSWFNRGFLVLRPIDWTTPANILEKIIEYEAVHDIGGWDELRRRLAPPDRRCFAFFHPQLNDEPLIFVEVALTQGIPARIEELLSEDRPKIQPEAATSAVFYSISNCQTGLRGVSFGNFLIKQVVEDLRRDWPNLETFVTLSPVPGFAKWLAGERKSPTVLNEYLLAQLDGVAEEGWHMRTDRALLDSALQTAAAVYFLLARSGKRLPDPVGRFHLGNGASLERINTFADLSPRGLREAHGMMVNYLYRLEDINANHEAFASHDQVVASSTVRDLIPPRQQNSDGARYARTPVRT